MREMPKSKSILFLRRSHRTGSANPASRHRRQRSVTPLLQRQVSGFTACRCPSPLFPVGELTSARRCKFGGTHSPPLVIGTEFNLPLDLTVFGANCVEERLKDVSGLGLGIFAEVAHQVFAQPAVALELRLAKPLIERCLMRERRIHHSVRAHVYRGVFVEVSGLDVNEPT